MAEQNIRITLGDYGSLLPVPADLQDEARRLDAQDLSPGDGILRWDDSSGEIAFEASYERLARAAVQQYAQAVTEQISTRMADAARRQDVATKARLFKDLKTSLASLGGSAPSITRLETDSRNGVYQVRLSKDLRYPGSTTSLQLVASDTAETIATKVNIARLHLPQLTQFAERNMSGLADEEQRRLRSALENVVAHAGLNEWSLAVPTTSLHRDIVGQAAHIARLSVEDDGRLVATAPSGAYAGTAELRVETLAGKKVLTNAWTSKDGRAQRLLMLTDNGWHLVRETVKR